MKPHSDIIWKVNLRFLFTSEPILRDFCKTFWWFVIFFVFSAYHNFRKLPKLEILVFNYEGLTKMSYIQEHYQHIFSLGGLSFLQRKNFFKIIEYQNSVWNYQNSSLVLFKVWPSVAIGWNGHICWLICTL